MAAGDSSTSIGNMALALVGEDPISNIAPPDNTKRATLAALFYDPVRRHVLEAAPWDCAKREARLAAAASAPPLGFNYTEAFPVPVDFLRMWEWPHQARPVYELMNLPGIGRCIASSAGPPLPITYIFDLQDPTQMDPLLITAIARGLGAELAIPLAREPALRLQLLAARDELIAAARLAGVSRPDAPQSTVEPIPGLPVAAAAPQGR